MRLINTETLELEEFMSETPSYAILSHTWGLGEVSFADMGSISKELKLGFAKIAKTCEVARGQGFGYAWVDTCCIDKSSSAELTESINSMFQWYKDSTICYAFLEDLHFDEDIRSCKWFTRGWTLQELLAPTEIEFYDAAWQLRGTRSEMLEILSKITRIPRNVLSGRRSLESCSVSRKMSWAAGRRTSRLEDIAYSLLGLFGVHMPTIYGEGMNAFRRLQEEIIKQKNDLTIFAWMPQRSVQKDVPLESQALGLLAESPNVFSAASNIEPFFDDFSTSFSVTNRGLRISGDAPLRLIAINWGTNQSCYEYRYGLMLGRDAGSLEQCGIFLRKGGPGLFFRDGQLPLIGLSGSDPRGMFKEQGQIEVSDYHILLESVTNPAGLLAPYRIQALNIPDDGLIRVHDAVPADLWDWTDRIFLKPTPYAWSHYSVILAARFTIPAVFEQAEFVTITLIRSKASGVDNSIRRAPICLMVPTNHVENFVARIFQGRYRNTSVHPSELEEYFPDCISWTPHLKFRAWTIAASLTQVAQHGETNLQTFNLSLGLISPDGQPLILRDQS